MFGCSIRMWMFGRLLHVQFFRTYISTTPVLHRYPFTIYKTVPLMLLIGCPGGSRTHTWSAIMINYYWQLIVVEIIYFEVFKLLHASSSHFTTKTHQPKCKQNCTTHNRSQNSNKGCSWQLHRCWWRMLEIKSVVDNFKMSVSGTKIQRRHQDQNSVTNIQKLSPFPDGFKLFNRGTLTIPRISDGV